MRNRRPRSRRVADALERCDLLKAPDARLRRADACDAGALVAEQEFGVVQPRFSSPTRFSTGTRTSSKNTSLTSWPPSMVWIAAP